MCYSVMVETDLKRLQREFQATVDLASLFDIYQRRSQGEPLIQIPRGYERFLADEAEGEAAKACLKLAGEFHQAELDGLRVELGLVEQKIKALTEKLAIKSTKTHTTALLRAERQKVKLSRKFRHFNGGLTAQDDNIFQYSYAPLIVQSGTQRVIRFFRYQLRPRWADTEVDRKINLFNARLDSVDNKKTWMPLWLKQHGALIYRGFYEWVPDPATGKSRVIQFFPGEKRLMWTPALYETYQSKRSDEPMINSFAILTREPPAEVLERGHDRCPVFPRWDFMARWLAPDSVSPTEIWNGLEDLEPVRYEAMWLKSV